ncbi:hypothetical protein [Nonomuraea longicatena]|uniref:Transposase n=1 Tax=Nonomuraea longicatena TaxID=83682 RepID=A0ABN1Q5Y6_9ACTN
MEIFGYQSPPDRPAVAFRKASDRAQISRHRPSSAKLWTNVWTEHASSCQQEFRNRAAAETRIQNDAIRAHPKKFNALRTAKVRQLETARRFIARR